MDIGIGAVGKTHRFPYLPVPVGTGAITPAKPDTQYKPGKCGEEKRDPVQFSGTRKDPAGQVE